MDNPVNSIIWSTPFMGNGDGFVTSGPFANWDTPFGRLVRNIGETSRLISKEVIRSILTRCRTSEISRPTAEAEFDLELAHGGPHVWIGGHMRGVATAAHDPIFFMHHAFIDYLWELFRIRQAIRCGVNPNTDYPPTVPMHEPDRRMDGFPQYRNTDGYRSFWTRFWYRYEISPTCSIFRPFCGTPYLRCDVSRSRCVSVARRIIVEPNTGASVMAFGAPNPMEASRARAEALSVRFGPSFDAPPSDGRTQDAGFRGRRRKRAVNQTTTTSENAPDIFRSFVGPPSDGRTSDALGFNIAHGIPSSDPIGPEPSIPGQILYSYAAPMPLMPHTEFPISSTQSSINKENMLNTNQVGYIPIGVIYRPPNYGPVASSRCQRRRSGYMRVDVKTEGLSYQGVYENSTYVDTRQTFHSSTIYTAIQLPENSVSEVLLSASDECGRDCQALCLNDSQMYQACDGILRLNASHSLYGNTIEEVVRKMTTGSHESGHSVTRQAEVQFICPREGQRLRRTSGFF